ncbi:hypothetical protein HD599_002169 [Conyzicola lurida]|uniref:Uncharacterized protein n=1 Tax=Conyzicola lurida TaxID=1172621 RepID=A0A841AQ66_9MICO|nr:hypothetical protein [Conyzicola lurida]MBB5843846.1 hypothetical protein [Conyzicola lurida]
MTRRARFAASLVILPMGLLALAGCAAAGDDVSMDGVVLVVGPDTTDRMQSVLTGVLGTNEAGCVSLDGAVIVAPMGSTISEDGQYVSLEGIGKFGLGETLPATGGGWIEWGHDGEGYGDCGGGEYAVLQPE